MTPDPARIMADVICDETGLDPHTFAYRVAEKGLLTLRAEGLEIVRFGVGYSQPSIPLHANQCDTGSVVIERWGYRPDWDARRQA